MGVFFVLLVIGSSIWVGFDASRLGARRGALGGGSLDMGPGSWFLVCLLFWILGFPCYLVARPRLIAARAAVAVPVHAASGVLYGVPAGYPPPPPPFVPQQQQRDISGQLHGLSQLHSTGALSDAEFMAAKARVLAG